VGNFGQLLGLGSNAAMDITSQYVLAEMKVQMDKLKQLDSFVQKVISVFLAEALSETSYQILTGIMVGDGTMNNDQALVARSIYAALITLYAPVVAWLIEKSRFNKQEHFLAIVLQLHGKICPVLLAWGWKDWASQLDTWAGVDLWDEIVIAVSLSLIIILLQALPCFRTHKAGVAAGGESDTLIARVVIVPASMALTLGYCWNLVATFFVGKVQDLHKTSKAHGGSAFAYQFVVQGVYAIVVCIIVTLSTVLLTEKKKAEDESQNQENSVDKWEGQYSQTWKQVAVSTMSFVYAWAILDTFDDFGFGIMFHCTSYSSCSYQSNFVYAASVTVCFAAGATMLQRWAACEEDSPVLKQAIALQINAMILTVGWAWMNFYTVFMDAGTAVASTIGLKVFMYICTMIFISTWTSIVMFIFRRMNIGLTRYNKKYMDAIKSSAASPAEAGKLQAI
jgi:hypothetical protein